MKFVSTQINDVLLIKPRLFGDERGFFMETWNRKRFEEAGIDAGFVQDNHSLSRRGILRGIHYQIKQPQGKLVRVIAGSVYDVAVDIRRSSPTFGKWVARVLSAENREMLWVPPGFAHGFYVISEYAEFLYKVTDYWAPEYERCIMWNDPDLAIDWPVPVGSEPVLSQKDSQGVLFRHAECFA